MLTVNRNIGAKVTNLPINVQNADMNMSKSKYALHLMDLVRSDSKNKYNYCKSYIRIRGSF